MVLMGGGDNNDGRREDDKGFNGDDWMEREG